MWTSVSPCGEADYPNQVECFNAQLALAAELERPVAVHCVKAYGDMADIFRKQVRSFTFLFFFNSAVRESRISRSPLLSYYVTIPVALKSTTIRQIVRSCSPYHAPRSTPVLSTSSTAQCAQNVPCTLVSETHATLT